LGAVRRYSLGAAAGVIVAVPLLLWLAPDVVRIFFTSKNAGATDALRLIVVAGALQFVFGWTKSFPVSIGRPNLRIWTHGVETLVLVPLVIAFGAAWGATGAAGAVLAATVVFVLYWSVLFLRIKREPDLNLTPPTQAADVVYTTGMFGRSALGATMARTPYVVKLTADPAFERSRRRGFIEGDVDEFQRSRGGPAVAMLRFARDVELRRAAHVFTPSAYLRELALGWGVRPDRVSVLPNPAPQ